MEESMLRNRLDIGRTASSGPEGRQADISGQANTLPGAYVPDIDVEEVPEYRVEEPAAAMEAGGRNGTTPNSEKTCRICLSGAEDGI